jgi:hypothetical protein
VGDAMDILLLLQREEKAKALLSALPSLLS